MTLPAAVNGGATGDANLQTWVSEPCLTWEGAGIGVNVNNDYTIAGCGVGGILMPKLNAGLGQAFIRFETNGGKMLFYTLNNATAPTGALAPRERMSINSAGTVRINGLAGTNNRPVYVTPNGTLTVGDSHAGNGYRLTDIAAWNGQEGNTWVEIISGTLTIRGCTEGCVYASATIRYTLNNVASAKVVMLITNDDTGGGGDDISGQRTVSVTNGGGAQTINTDIGKGGSDGHVQTVFVTYNPLP
jgi:hypothetical protein